MIRTQEVSDEVFCEVNQLMFNDYGHKMPFEDVFAMTIQVESVMKCTGKNVEDAYFTIVEE